jgi:hypothetical protein
MRDNIVKLRPGRWVMGIQRSFFSIEQRRVILFLLDPTFVAEQNHFFIPIPEWFMFRQILTGIDRYRVIDVEVTPDDLDKIRVPGHDFFANGILGDIHRGDEESFGGKDSGYLFEAEINILKNKPEYAPEKDHIERFIIVMKSVFNIVDVKLNSRISFAALFDGITAYVTTGGVESLFVQVGDIIAVSATNIKDFNSGVRLLG